MKRFFCLSALPIATLGLAVFLASQTLVAAPLQEEGARGPRRGGAQGERGPRVPREGGPREGGSRDGGSREGGPQHGPDDMPHGMGPHQGPPPNPFMELFDTDQDDVVSAEEITAAVAVLKALDTNGDGKLTREEFPRPPHRPHSGPGGRDGQRGPREGRQNRRGGRPEMDDDQADNDTDHGRPVEKIAADLGVTPEAFLEAFKKVRPARRGEQPTREHREQNRKVLSEALGVDPEKLDKVMDKYRPEGKTNGPRQSPDVSSAGHLKISTRSNSE